MKKTLLFLILLSAGITAAAQQRIGIIGLDTSHSPAFARLVNQSGDLPRKFVVTAAYPYGTTTIESARSRIPKYTEEIKRYGVEITDSIGELLDQVDCILLETNDGNLHLEQAAQVFKAGKKIYIDKPVGATLGQAIAIYELAERYGATFFSSSALRFTVRNQEIRSGKFGAVRGADCYSPHSPEPSHADFGYYGLHGVEELYTVMGTGCEAVSRIHSEKGDIVTGKWKDGRLGSFRAIIGGPYAYGGTIYLEKEAVPTGGYTGYQPLVDEILRFFETGICPVSREETLEIFTFMEASNMSLKENGALVTLEAARKAGEKEAQRLLKAYGRKEKVRQMAVVNPGHFHAALVLKGRLAGVSPDVQVYAPEGPELQAFLDAVGSGWNLHVHTGKGLPKAGKGDFVVLAGDNHDKAASILAAVQKGYHVLADKPLAITPDDYRLLVEAFRTAGKKGLTIYELMTERYDTQNRIVQALVADRDFFGEMVSIEMESVHHFYKNVAGNILRRPAWYYDISQQGEGIADVTTHLIDQVFWAGFPGRTLTSADVTLLDAEHSRTWLTPGQFTASTAEEAFPSFLAPYIEGERLGVYSNGSLLFQVDGIPVHIAVRWDYEAPAGSGDTASSVFEGSLAQVATVQDGSTSYIRQIQVSAPAGRVRTAEERLREAFPYVRFVEQGEGRYLVDVPLERRTSHEDHFHLLTGAFLRLVGSGTPPAEGISNTLVKYGLTTAAVELARKKDP